MFVTVSRTGTGSDLDYLP